MTYSKAYDKLFIMDLTDVSARLRGQCSGKQLVMKAFDYAGTTGIKILPLGRFARSVFDKAPEIADVLN